MMRVTKPVLLLSIAALGLAACTDGAGNPRQKTTEGALVGGVIGGILGASRGGNKSKNVIIGTAIGATVGGLVGQQLDRQEDALRNSIGNDQVGIVNTGSELIVTLPEEITFDTGSAMVRSSLLGDLNALAANLNDFPDTTVDVIGHTDSVGDAGYNQKLSSDRANSVLAILTDDGVDNSRMRAIGRGESEPKASNLSPEGRAQNRRVEIIIRPKA
ncbi:MAG: OmpA family protein [Rhodobacteraceae bacterium]|nr:OmpA family protein [Paracoccaceae bacterium]